MFLKYIEAVGFKSFADKVRIGPVYDTPDHDTTDTTVVAVGEVVEVVADISGTGGFGTVGLYRYVGDTDLVSTAFLSVILSF